MRIVHVTQFFMPWLGYLSYHLPREQVRAGHDVTVVSSNLRWPGGHYGVLAEEGVSREMPVGPGEELGVPCVRLETHRFQPKSMVYLKGLRASLERLQPELVVAYLYAAPSTLQVALLQEKLGFRLLVVESQLPTQARLGWKNVALRRVVRALTARFLLPRTERIVTCAHGASDWLESAYGVGRERTTFIPLGVDPTVFRPDPEGRAARRASLGFGPEDYVVGYTGKLVPLKRVEALVDAVAACRARVPAQLLLVGKGASDYVESLRARAAGKGVPLVLHDSVASEQLATYFNAADVCVWPADCSISHLEALACGTPIIIPENIGVDDRVGGDNGLLVPLGDVSAIAAGLEALFDSERRGEMSANAAQWASAHYHWSAVAEAWAGVAAAGGQLAGTVVVG